MLYTTLISLGVVSHTKSYLKSEVVGGVKALENTSKETTIEAIKFKHTFNVTKSRK